MPKGKRKSKGKSQKNQVSLFHLPDHLEFLNHIELAVSEAEESQDTQQLTWTVGDEFGAEYNLTLWKRALLSSSEPVDSDEEEDYRSYTRLIPREETELVYPLCEHIATLSKVLVVLCHGGYFAAAVFDNGVPTIHKAFSHYVVRRKQGQRQGNKDRTKSVMKSAGSAIRRDQEVKHEMEVHELFQQDAWQDALEFAGKVFYFAPGPINKAILFGDESQPFRKGDPRFISIPFPTDRPSFGACKKAFAMLTSATVVCTREGSGPGAAAAATTASATTNTTGNVAVGSGASGSRGVSVVVDGLDGSAYEDEEGEGLVSPYAELLSPLPRTKMRPAEDVLNRITWDWSLGQENDEWVVGYEDRFDGVKEVDVDRWFEGYTSAHGSGSFPLHRIRYFKRAGDVVWDRRGRHKFDAIFYPENGAGASGEPASPAAVAV